MEGESTAPTLHGMPALAVAIESMLACWEELQPLATAHWDEVVHEAGHRARLDREAFAAAESKDRLLFLTARDAGRLVGYVAILIVQHPHATGMRVAEVNGLYLQPEHRQGRNAQELVGFAHATLREHGVDLIYQASRVNHDLSPLFLSMGYQASEILWCKHLHPTKREE